MSELDIAYAEELIERITKALDNPNARVDLLAAHLNTLGQWAYQNLPALLQGNAHRKGVK